jgi:hypothetical protein
MSGPVLDHVWKLRCKEKKSIKKMLRTLKELEVSLGVIGKLKISTQMMTQLNLTVLLTRVN